MGFLELICVDLLSLNFSHFLNHFDWNLLTSLRANILLGLQRAYFRKIFQELPKAHFSLISAYFGEKMGSIEGIWYYIHYMQETWRNQEKLAYYCGIQWAFTKHPASPGFTCQTPGPALGWRSELSPAGADPLYISTPQKCLAICMTLSYISCVSRNLKTALDPRLEPTDANGTSRVS